MMVHTMIQTVCNTNYKAKVCSGFVFVVAGLFCSQAMAADFYRWVDDKGSTHYTQEAPPKKSGKKVLKKVTVDTFQSSSVYQPQGAAIPNANNSNAPVATNAANSAPATTNTNNTAAPSGNSSMNSNNTGSTVAPSTTTAPMLAK